MKKSLFLISALFAIGFLHAQTPAASDEEKSNDINKVIEFKETEHDFGKIPYGKSAEFDVVMKNVSPDTIRLQNVQAGCGCTTPQWKPGPYQPGETFKITIGFNGYAINSDGSFSKTVTLYLANGMTQIIKFHGLTYKTPENPAPGNAAIEKMKPGKK